MNTQVLYVLLVEDDVDYSALLRRRLMGSLNQDNGQLFVVAQASLLREAIDYSKAHPVDVIVLDLNLADTTGLDTLVRIQQAVPKAATIVLTGRDDQTMHDHVALPGPRCPGSARRTDPCCPVLQR